VWPGNVRELKNVVERAVYRSDSAVIKDIEFDPFRLPYDNNAAAELAPAATNEQKTPELNHFIEKPLKTAVWELKIKMLEDALKKARYNQKKAARILGLTYHQFRGLYRQYQKVGQNGMAEGEDVD
jgi:psp operon transcriptional activator